MKELGGGPAADLDTGFLECECRPGSFAPGDEQAAAALVRDFAANGHRVTIVGGQSRPETRSIQGVPLLSSRNLAGIVEYEPADRVITVLSGTPLADVADELARQHQRLTFEPPDHRRLLGTRGRPTVGAAIACDAKGPRGVLHGGAGKALVGARAINGRGEVLQCGSRTLKNVAGLDLAKLLVNSRGSLAFLTQLSLRVEYLPEAEVTLGFGLEVPSLQDALFAARAASLPVSSATYLCGSSAGRAGIEGLRPSEGLALFRLEGSRVSLTQAAAAFRSLMVHGRQVLELAGLDSLRLSEVVRDQRFFGSAEEGDLWHLAARHAESLELTRLLHHHGRRLRVQASGCGRQAWVCPAPGSPREWLSDVAVIPGLAITCIRGTAPSIGASRGATGRMAALGSTLKASFDPAGIFLRPI